MSEKTVENHKIRNFRRAIILWVMNSGRRRSKVMQDTLEELK
jgi:hypothetical protein